MLKATRLQIFNHIMAVEAFNHIMAVCATLWLKSQSVTSVARASAGKLVRSGRGTRLCCLMGTSCYVNLQEKKKALPLSGTSNRLTHFSLCPELRIGTPCQRSQASRLNHLLFEVTAIATPQVAYAFVTRRCPALHTFNRAGRGAGTRRDTKSQLSRCSYLSENASIREERFRNPSYPFVAWGS